MFNLVIFGVSLAIVALILFESYHMIQWLFKDRKFSLNIVGGYFLLIVISAVAMCLFTTYLVNRLFI